MRRREFIALVAGATAWTLNARAQQALRLWRVGITTIQPRASPPYVALEQRLRELGYIEGQNLIVDVLNPEDQSQGMDGAIRELLRRKVDVIVAPYESAVKSALAATDTVPIVMIAADYDPLALGYIKSLARPDRNVTGLFLQEIDLVKKRLQLLRDALPDLREATMFWNAASVEQWKAAQSVSADFGFQLAGIELGQLPYDYDRALAQAPLGHRNALIIPTSPVFYRDRQRLADLALRYRMPSIFGLREWVEAGGLLSYGASFHAMFGRAANYIDKIAKGAKPGDLPIEQPNKFDLAVNLKTAKAIDFVVPPAILLRADEVIE
jgi:putative ABC transport system substrate-binding protein